MMNWKSIAAATMLSAGLVFAVSSGAQAGAPMTSRIAAPDLAVEGGVQLTSHRRSYRSNYYQNRRYKHQRRNNIYSYRGCRLYYDDWGNAHCGRSYARRFHSPFFFGFSFGNPYY